MKLSFQTFCLIFLVTIVHFVVITVFSPMTKSATDFFSNLDVETILENGREDYSSLQNNEIGPLVAEPLSSGVVPVTRESGDYLNRIEEEIASALLQEKTTPEDEILVSEPVVAVAKPVRGAVTDVRVLSERITRPELLMPKGKLQKSKVSEESQREEGTSRVVRGEDMDFKGAAPKAGSGSGRLQIREIRPL